MIVSAYASIPLDLRDVISADCRLLINIENQSGGRDVATVQRPGLEGIKKRSVDDSRSTCAAQGRVLEAPIDVGDCPFNFRNLE